MKEIKLKNGQYTKVDNDDFEKFKNFSWFLIKNVYKSSSYYYVTRSNNGKPCKLHREIMGSPKGLMIDHINHDTLDNRKCNLRVCTHQDNQRNRNLNKNNTTGFKGVTYHKHKEYIYYVAQLYLNGKNIFLGTFKKSIDAAKKYDEEVTRLFGDFALTNKKLGLFNNSKSI